MSLGSNIRKYRRELGITQEELAGILCVSAQAVSKWESEAGLPDVSQIVPLAQTLSQQTSFSVLIRQHMTESMPTRWALKQIVCVTVANHRKAHWLQPDFWIRNVRKTSSITES